MKVLLSWMQQFAPIEGDPAELAETLTDLGLVVEEVSTVGADLDGIIVAKVLELAPHPEADRIQVVQVDTGDGTPLQICCGAFNMAVGDLVPLATIGTTMPGGMEIAQRKLRGQMSNGMLCSPAELELAADADGIMVLDPSLTLGQPITEALALESDVLFDIDVEGNRPDALSVIGVARDLAAKLGVPFTEPSPVVAESSANTADLASVEILDGELCPRFGIRVLENVTMGSSPEWMAARLTAAGMRPINSIVDISNYVMLELGQPNHTYDLDTVPDGALRVRRASEGETLVTLDGKLRSLTPADGVIANAADEPIGLAGVMGGEATEIGPSTSRVLLEAAIWDRMMIAKTSRRLNLRSEASTRYERGVDHAAVERALDRFCELAIELCGATVASGAIIADGRELPAPVVTLRTARVNQLLGSSLTTDEIANFLTPIGFANTADGPDALTVTIPSWRPDSTMETDIVEEVGRHYGYDKVGTLVPRPAQSGGLTHRQTARRRVRHAVAGIGFDEAMPMPFLSPADQAAAGISDEAIGLTNPLVHEESILRTSLLPGLVKAVASNQARSNDGVRLFELGRVYLRNPKTLDDPVAAPLPIEPERLGLVWAGADAGDAVRVFQQIAGVLGLANIRLDNADGPASIAAKPVLAGLHPYRTAEIVLRGRTIGAVGEIDPGVLEAFDVEGRVAWVGFDLDPVFAAMETVPKATPVSVYPASELDLAFVVTDDIAASTVAGTLYKTGGALLRSVEVFDVFRSESLGADRRSLAYRLRFQADDRTLTDADLTGLRDQLIAAVAKRHKAELRS
ncbi:MAG: phenylalanine--tRNA ligase subunit beta [Acidimicrobiales bacterium]